MHVQQLLFVPKEERGWLDEREVVLESLLAFRRAGADLIITYHALDAAAWMAAADE